jgi:hypothetical protein
LRVRNNFGGRASAGNRADVRKAWANYEVQVKAGDVVEATVAAPARE